MNIVVVDIGMGNIGSLVSALEFLGATYSVSDRESDILNASHLILPGVGIFDAAMNRLTAANLIIPIRESVLNRNTQILGICLGMQLLFSSSEEGSLSGLNLVQGKIERLQSDPSGQFKVPHVGFAKVTGFVPTGLFEGFGHEEYFYFTHSFALKQNMVDGFNAAYFQHSTQCLAAFQHQQINGAQFHPEKSQSSGLRMLRNYIAGNYRCVV